MTLADLIAQVLQEFITINQQRATMGNALAGIPGLKKVFTYRPKVLVDAELPALLPVPGAARHDRELYAESLRIRRDWSLWIPVLQHGQGREYEGEMLAEPFVDYLAIAVAACPLLYLDEDSADRAEGCRAFAMAPTADSCVCPFPYGGKTYYAAEQRITTTFEATVPRLE